jgi:glycosyltransferase involved in cell wall biosynthesis
VIEFLYPSASSAFVRRPIRCAHGRAEARPRISVAIPTFNRREVVQRAVQSVLTQTLPPDEVLVIDDGSIDGTADALATFFGKRVRLLLQSNNGPAAARNTGVKAASGELVAFLDSDDRWLPHHLAAIETLASRCPGAWCSGRAAATGPATRLPTTPLLRTSPRTCCSNEPAWAACRQWPSAGPSCSRPAQREIPIRGGHRDLPAIGLPRPHGLGRRRRDRGERRLAEGPGVPARVYPFLPEWSARTVLDFLENLLEDRAAALEGVMRARLHRGLRSKRWMPPGRRGWPGGISVPP